MKSSAKENRMEIVSGFLSLEKRKRCFIARKSLALKNRLRYLIDIIVSE